MIGGFRERITFEVEEGTADGGGGSTAAWGNIPTTPTVWAEVKPVRGSESVDAGHLASKQTYLVTIRYRSDITTKMRINWKGVYMNIRSVQNRDMKKKYLSIEAETGVTQ